MVTDPTYTGRAAAFRRMSIKVKSSRTGRRYVGAVDRPIAEQVILPAGTVERIVSDDLFIAANARLAANKRDSRRNNRNPEGALLRCGFVRCGYCGRAMAIRSRTGRSGQYSCKTTSDGPRACPGSPSMDAAELDGIVWKHVTETLTDPEVIRREVKRRALTDANGQGDRQRVSRLIEDVDQRRRNLTANLALLDPDSAADVRAMLSKLSDERHTLEAQRRSADERHEQHKAERDRLAAIDAWCRRVGTNLSTMTYAQRRDALSALQGIVRVWKVGHQPRYEVTLQVLGGSANVETTGTAGSTDSQRRGQSGGV
jgi:site-specific DNA recombinase